MDLMNTFTMVVVSSMARSGRGGRLVAQRFALDLPADSALNPPRQAYLPYQPIIYLETKSLFLDEKNN